MKEEGGAERRLHGDGRLPGSAQSPRGSAERQGGGRRVTEGCTPRRGGPQPGSGGLLFVNAWKPLRPLFANFLPQFAVGVQSPARSRLLLCWSPRQHPQLERVGGMRQGAELERPGQQGADGPQRGGGAGGPGVHSEHTRPSRFPSPFAHSGVLRAWPGAQESFRQVHGGGQPQPPRSACTPTPGPHHRLRGARRLLQHYSGPRARLPASHGAAFLSITALAGSSAAHSPPPSRHLPGSSLRACHAPEHH